MPERKKITLATLLEKKANNEKISRTALYDYPMALIAEEAGIEVINVGDSIANVMFGYNTTIKADLDVMVEHAKAVRRGAPTAFIMGDMPFLSYQCSMKEAIRNAGRYLVEADMDCVKIEGGLEVVPIIKTLTEFGIPVIGHTGLTPQTALKLGGYKTQGRSAEAAMKLIETADAFVDAGCIALTVEAIPLELGRVLYDRCPILFFATGCGGYTDSPFNNWYDMLGLYARHPKFSKVYANARQCLLEGAAAYVEEVKEKKFPTEEHSYKMLPGEEERMLKMLSEMR